MKNKNENTKTSKIFIVSQIIFVIILVGLLAFGASLIFKKPTYKTTQIKNYRFDLNQDITWEEYQKTDDSLSYSGTLRNTNICYLTIYDVEGYDKKDSLTEALKKYYDQSKDYSDISNINKTDNYESITGSTSDGGKMETRVYDSNSYITIIWSNSLELDECMQNITYNK